MHSQRDQNQSVKLAKENHLMQAVLLRLTLLAFCLLASGCEPAEPKGADAASMTNGSSSTKDGSAKDSPAFEPLSASTVLTIAGVDSRKIGPTFVYATGSRIRDKDLNVFQQLPELTSLSLGDTRIDGSGLKDLHCPKLRTLSLFSTNVTDANLNQLPLLPELEMISLADTPIDGSCFEHLAIFANLRTLELGNTQVTDAPLAHLANFKSLKSIELANANITDAAIQHLVKCPTLRVLDLSETSITDVGARELATQLELFNLNLDQTAVTDEFITTLTETSAESLAMLRLRGTRITSKCVEHLAKLQRLEVLDVRDTGISEGDLGTLSESLSRLRKLNKPD